MLNILPQTHSRHRGLLPPGRRVCLWRKVGSVSNNNKKFRYADDFKKGWIVFQLARILFVLLNVS